jgi:cytochrome P450
MVRKAVKDFAFSDGTFIPKNTFICVAAFPMHHDDENYANADIFDLCRSADMRISEGEGIKHQIVRVVHMW